MRLLKLAEEMESGFGICRGAQTLTLRTAVRFIVFHARINFEAHAGHTPDLPTHE